MAITSQTSSIEYDGNNSDVTAYAVPFLFFADSHLKVTVTTAAGVADVLTLTTDYAVTGANNPAGGTVVTEVPYDDTHTVKIERVVPLTQPYVYEEGGRLPMKTLEKNFDTLAMHNQQQQRVIDTLPTEATVDQKIEDAQFEGIAGERVVELLEDQDVPVASIGLSDGTGTALPSGSITLNAAGELVIHDNESNAEDLPHLVNSREALHFSKAVTFAAGAATASTLLAEIPLSSAQLVNNKRLHLAGLIRGLWEVAVPSGFSGFLVICKEGQTVASSGIHLNIAEATTFEERGFHLPLLFSVTTGTWTIIPAASAAVGIAKLNNGGTLTEAEVWTYGVDYIDQSSITGSAGEPVKLQLHLLETHTSSATGATLFLSGQLSAISQ